jgi:hypothetical protein
MQAIIDKSVPFAHKYYSTYLAEPSPAGDITLSPNKITAVDHMTLEALLSQMKSVGRDGELLVATHSSPKGFMMALAAGAQSSLLFSVMDKIDEILEGIRRREAIDALPSRQAPEAWRRWYIDFEPGIKLEPGYETNPDWKSYVEQQYERWFERQGSQILKLRRGGAEMKQLLDLLVEVRKLGFKRLEFRACQIGADTKAMERVARFFQVNTVVGPKDVQTFYGAFAASQLTLISDPKKLAAALKKLAGRKFGSNMGIEVFGRGFKIVAQDQDALKAFVTKYISANYKGKVDPFVVGGLNSVGNAPTQYVFPLESDYKKLIERFGSTTNAKAATP